MFKESYVVPLMTFRILRQLKAFVERKWDFKISWNGGEMGESRTYSKFIFSELF